MNIFLTGCTGFLGSHILFLLCKQNKHQIYCIIRNPNDINLFKEFPNINYICRFIISSIDTPQKYSCVLKKCHMAIHTASPVILTKLSSPEEEKQKIIYPAINNVRNILDNVNKSIFKRIIFTSSVAALYNKDKFCNENCWNFNNDNPYTISKVLSEVECFKYKLKGIDVVSINPGAFFGPDIIDKKSKNNKLIQRILHSPYYPFSVNIKMTFCDVRDVAKFHVYALNMNKIKTGRYIVCNKTIDAKTIINRCIEIAPEKVKKPIVYINKNIVKNALILFGNESNELLSYIDYEPAFDNSKSKKFINYTNMDNTLESMLNSM